MSRYNKKPKFQMVGNTMHTTEPYEFDWMTIAENLSPNELLALRMIRDARAYKFSSELQFTNDGSEYKSKWDINPYITFIPSKTLNKVDYKRFRKGLPKLFEMELVQRVKRNVFLLNPWLIVPNNFSEHSEVWFQHLNQDKE